MGKLIPFTNRDMEHTLPVVSASFKERADWTPDELFSGFDDLKIITYSYDLGFISELAKKFKTMSVLLGCQRVVEKKGYTAVLVTAEASRKNQIADASAAQKVAIDYIKQYPDLVDRIRVGSVSFKVAKCYVSHEKTFLMSTEGGRVRVVTGSANCTWRGFGGLAVQMEDHVLFDNDPCAYEHYMTDFDILDRECMNPVAMECLYAKDASEADVDADDADIAELPIFREAKMNSLGVVVPTAVPDEEEIAQYVTDVSDVADEYLKVIPKPAEKDGKLWLKPASLIKIEAKWNAYQANKKKIVKKPASLYVNYETDVVTYNGKPYPTAVDMEGVKSDLTAMQAYFAGFDRFIGSPEEIAQTERVYFKMLIFMLMSPFTAMLRHTAHAYNFSEEMFPYFAVLIGPKSAGKTFFTRMVQRLMVGEEPDVADKSAWTPTQMRGNMANVDGIPVCIDDLSQKRFKEYADEIVKCDSDLYVKEFDHHGIYVITSNGIRPLDPPLAKRIYWASVSITQDNVTATRNKKSLNDLVDSLSLSFYGAFIKRALPAVHELMDRMATYSAENEEDIGWQPDMFSLASGIYRDLCAECGLPIPGYADMLTYADYFGYNESLQDIKRQVRDAWEYNKSAFARVLRNKTLVYTPGENNYEATWIANSLPETVRARVVGKSVVMDLDSAQEFFGLSFKRGLFKR